MAYSSYFLTIPLIDYFQIRWENKLNPCSLFVCKRDSLYSDALLFANLKPKRISMTLMIGKHSVVSINYTLRDDAGQTMDNSEEAEPLVYLHGTNNLIPGLENELQGKVTGAKFVSTISPKDAYGEISEEFIQTLGKEMFQDVESVEVGMTFMAQGEGGQQRQVRVTAVEGEEVTIDANHPMAGKTLHFDVEVVEVREATDQEMEHGHVHQDGHDH